MDFLKDNKVLIIGVAVMLLSIGLIVLFTLVDISLGPIKISSIKTILSQKQVYEKSSNELNNQKSQNTQALTKLKTEQQNFKTEKTKYDAISDDTVRIIKEATTEEKYSLEYMWIKLGNYAKSNNLSIVLVEPGGAASNAANATNTPTQGGTSTGQTTNQTTTPSPTPQAQATDNTGENPNPYDTSSANTIFKIEVEGSYIDMSDFIFEVENDKELRFKLDNIAIQYVSGTTIKTKFDVKNLNINK